MTILRTPLVWSGLIVAILIGIFVADPPWLRAALPFLAAVAWVYVGWRLFAERRAMRVPVVEPEPAPPPVDRSTPLPPRIKGEVVTPEVAPSIDIAEMRDYLSDRLIGQEMVADQIARGLFRGLSREREDKPVFSALLCGPAGAGKTEMAEAVARYLYGDRDRLFRVGCADLQSDADLHALTGAPGGPWGALSVQLRDVPRSVLLFDDIEKAGSPQAIIALLRQLLEEGVCTEQSDGTRVSASDAVILVTANAGQETDAIAQRHRDEPDRLVRATRDALQGRFAPELLAQLDLVSAFAPLDDAGRARVIALHAGRIGRAQGVQVESIDASFVNEGLRRWATIEGTGTRAMVGWIEQAVGAGLSQAKSQGRRKVGLAWSDGRVEVTRP